MTNNFEKKTLFSVPFYLALSLAASSNAFAGNDLCGNSKYATPFTQSETTHDAASASETSRLNNLDYHEQVCQNIAISSALEDPDLVYGETKGLRINFATAGEQDVPAIGITGAVILSNNAFGSTGRLTGNAGIAFSGDQRGSRLGLQLSW